MRQVGEIRARRDKKRVGGRVLLFLRIVYWQPFYELAFNHCAQSPC